jgi:acyl-CoA reductase-like NAD-dependent aldehyde dehydrogenase
VGDVLTTHKLVKTISFCGSPRIGQQVAQLAAQSLKTVTLELGGKSPLLILDDADLDAAVQAATMGTFFFQGQACMASSRIYVQRGIAEEFTDKFVAAAKDCSIGNLRAADSLVGPIISDRQRERVRHHIADAKAKGAKLLTGGDWQGNCCQPTVFTEVTKEMTLCREETFGPVTSIYVFDSIDEALMLANDTDYGLSFSVYSQDIDTALDIAYRAQSGAVHINRPTVQDEPCPPFGGQGLSGLGREGTEAELDVLTQWKWITIRMKQ